MSEVKKCPHCGEEIKAIAKKCRHCGNWVNEEKQAEQPKQKKECIACAEEIDADAKVCKFCKQDQSDEEQEGPDLIDKIIDKTKKVSKSSAKKVAEASKSTGKFVAENYKTHVAENKDLYISKKNKKRLAALFTVVIIAALIPTVLIPAIFPKVSCSSKYVKQEMLKKYTRNNDGEFLNDDTYSFKEGSTNIIATIKDIKQLAKSKAACACSATFINEFEKPQKITRWISGFTLNLLSNAYFDQIVENGALYDVKESKYKKDTVFVSYDKIDYLPRINRISPYGYKENFQDVYEHFSLLSEGKNILKTPEEVEEYIEAIF